MNEHNNANPAPIAVNGAVSHTPLFIRRRNLAIPLRPTRRAVFDGTKWISVGQCTGADKSRALEGNGVTEQSSIADFASVVHKKNDATAFF